MPIRKLTSLYETRKGSDVWYVDFAYYEKDEYGHLEWTGDSETCELTEDELYEMVKPKLKAEKTVLKRR